MKKPKQISAIALISWLGLAASSPSRAQLVTSVYGSTGATVITDTVSGLSWLDVSATDDLTPNQFETGVGGWNANFSFATRAQVQQLFADAGLTDANGYSASEFTVASEFTSLFDPLDNACAGGGSTQFVCALYPSGGGTIDLVNVGFAGGQGFSYIFPSYDTVANANDAEFTGYGLMLVEDPSPVPVPAGAWLLLSGLVGLVAMLRKRSSLNSVQYTGG
jgi:hypothetical protein